MQHDHHQPEVILLSAAPYRHHYSGRGCSQCEVLRAQYYQALHHQQHHCTPTGFHAHHNCRGGHCSILLNCLSRETEGEEIKIKFILSPQSLVFLDCCHVSLCVICEALSLKKKKSMIVHLHLTEQFCTQHFLHAEHKVDVTEQMSIVQSATILYYTASRMMIKGSSKWMRLILADMNPVCGHISYMQYI